MLPLLLLLLQTTAPPRLAEFLQQSIGFDSAQLAAVERGEPVVKVLEARNSRDVGEMRDCKPGDCVVKLPATDMRRIHDQMNWSAPAPELQAQLSAYARRRLVEYVTDYRTRGDSAMAIYDDRGNLNVHASEAFAAQLAESRFVYQNVPSLG